MVDDVARRLIDYLSITRAKIGAHHLTFTGGDNQQVRNGNSEALQRGRRSQLLL